MMGAGWDVVRCSACGAVAWGRGGVGVGVGVGVGGVGKIVKLARPPHPVCRHRGAALIRTSAAFLVHTQSTFSYISRRRQTSRRRQ